MAPQRSGKARLSWQGWWAPCSSRPSSLRQETLICWHSWRIFKSPVTTFRQLVCAALHTPAIEMIDESTSLNRLPPSDTSLYLKRHFSFGFKQTALNARKTADGERCNSCRGICKWKPDSCRLLQDVHQQAELHYHSQQHSALSYWQHCSR